MKNILIIEDEAVTAKNLTRMLRAYNPSFQIAAPISSVSEALSWLTTNPTPDLIFLDVQLGDGLSFEIFEELEITTPVVFTTAYDTYIQKAFELNSVDYLLKPLSPERLAKSLDKYKKLYENQEIDSHVSRQQEKRAHVTWDKPDYKSRFLVKVGKQLRIIPTQQIAYFMKDGLVVLIDKKGGKYVVDYSLDELSQLLSPQDFFRINRQYLIKLDSIEEIHQEKQAVSLYLSPQPYTYVTVSQRNTSGFKKWLEEV